MINENDIITISDQVFGDNDQLAAHVTHYTNSDLLVILSDIDGYDDKNPLLHSDARMISHITEIPGVALDDTQTPNNEFATGGIVTKLMAAKFLMNKGCKMFLCNGYDLTTAEQYLLEGVQGKGTLFEPPINQ